MRVVIFCHSLISDWNHGNAHFLRGIAGELMHRGHTVSVLEPRDAWSVVNLVAEYGDDATVRYRAAYPWLDPVRYDLKELDIDEALDGADLVLVHEWNDPNLVAAIGAHRLRSGRYTLLFHDTHHRALTRPEEMRRYDLSCYDGALVFGNVLREIYLRNGWAGEVHTWHEAADTRVFRPRPDETCDGDLVWIGNWGDDERSSELSEFLIEPVRALGLRALVHGVRYPAEAIARLRNAGIAFGGWLPNHESPRTFARHRVTVHLPRQPYRRTLPGIPTIRVFEALACGIPLVTAPWDDVEGLFHPGRHFIAAENGDAMRRHLRDVLGDEALRAELAASGLRAINARHTCAHRVDELIAIHHSRRPAKVETLTR